MTKRTMATKLTCAMVCLCFVVNQPYYRQPKNANLPKERKAKLVYSKKIVFKDCAQNERFKNAKNNNIAKQIAEQNVIEKHQEEIDQQKQLKIEQQEYQQKQREQQEEERQQQIRAQEIQQQSAQQNNNSKINIELSFYTNNTDDCGKTDAISSSGKHLDASYIYCAAPLDVPFGTIIKLENGQTLIVVDRGGAIRWVYKNGQKVMKLDVFVKDVSEDYLRNKGVVNTQGYIKQ